MKKPLDVALSTHSKGVPLTFSMGNPRCEKYCGHMKLRRVLAIATIGFITIGITPAIADPLTKDQAIAIMKDKYDPKFDSQVARLESLKPKAFTAPSTKKWYLAIEADIVEVRRVINNSMASVLDDYQGPVGYAEEETGEFDSYLSDLETKVKAIKSINCVKGKTTKRITEVKPICPKGYTKKK